jgi:hypothetical protein
MGLASGEQYYKTFFFVAYKSAKSNICGKGQEPTVDCTGAPLG